MRKTPTTNQVASLRRRDELAVLRLSPPSPQFSPLILGTDPVLRGARPQKECQKHLVILTFFAIIAKMVENENPMRNILGLILLRSKKV